MLRFKEDIMSFTDLKSKVKNVKNITLYDVLDFGNKVGKQIDDAICVSTAIVVVSSPIQALADTAIAEAIGRGCYNLDIHFLNLNNLLSMTDGNSIGAKFGMAKLMYGGLGWAYGKLRDKSRKVFGLGDKSKESLQGLHDFIFTLTYSSSMLVGSYMLGGEHDWTKIGTALFIAGITQPVRGPYIGRFTDYYRDLLGLKECNRSTYPEKIKNLGRTAKLGVAALGVAASVGLMAAIYGLTPTEWNNSNRLAERNKAKISIRYEVPSTLNQIPSQVYSPINSSGLEDVIKR